MPVLLRWFLRLGPTNPIAVRLVQNGSRRQRHLYIRSAYLAAVILVLLWQLVTTVGGSGAIDYRELALAGSQSFIFVAYLQIGLICVLAPVFMAGAISQEADPKTWEVMLTTPLGPTEIVLGNLFGRLFFILALLFSSLPLFALIQVFGGVPMNTIFASYGVAACAAVLVGVIAIGLSVSRLAGRRAVFTFYVGVVTYLAITAALDAFIRASGGGAGPAGEGVTHFTSLNPFLALRALLNPATYPRGDMGDAWWIANPVSAWCYGSLLLSTALILASSLTVRAGGLQTLVSGQSSSKVPWYRKMFGLGASGAEFRPPRTVGQNPIAWREATARNSTLFRIIARWSFVVLGGLFGLGLVAWYHAGQLDHTTFRLAILYTILGEMAVITLVAMNMAATAVSREREDGTLDLLLTTSITPASYLSGKLKGLIAYLLPLLAVPVGTVAVAGLYAFTGGLGRSDGVTVAALAGHSDATPVVLPEAGIVAALVCIPFAAFCVMIGLQWSLKSKGTISSVVGTVGVVGIVAGVIGTCGWRSGIDFEVIGPALAASNPASALFALVSPGEALDSTAASTGGLSTARVALLMGAGVSAAVYAGVVYGIQASMVKNFDFTVRKLAGTK
ncbi:MAG: ABC transporter permease subunit [Planctomycetota bacterium]